MREIRNKQNKKKKVQGRLDSHLPSAVTEAQTGSQLSSGETEARGTDAFIRNRRPDFEFGKEREASQVLSLPTLLLPHLGPASVSLPSQMVRAPGVSFPSRPQAPRQQLSRISLIRLCAGPPAHNQPQG